MAKKEVDDVVTEPTADEMADLSINLDIEKTAKDEALKEVANLQKKNDDLVKANSRLMKRVSEKADIEDKKEEAQVKNTKLSDMYDFSKGRLVLKK